VDGAKPASGSAAPSTSVATRSLVIEQVSRVGVVDAEGDTRYLSEARHPPFWSQARCVITVSTASRRRPIAVQPGAPAARATGEHVGVMEQSVERAVFEERTKVGGDMALLSFDVLELDGCSVMCEPWEHRRKRLS
jgi:hypothetical protein